MPPLLLKFAIRQKESKRPEQSLLFQPAPPQTSRRSSHGCRPVKHSDATGVAVARSTVKQQFSVAQSPPKHTSCTMAKCYCLNRGNQRLKKLKEGKEYGNFCGLRCLPCHRLLRPSRCFSRSINLEALQGTTRLIVFIEHEARLHLPKQ